MTVKDKLMKDLESLYLEINWRTMIIYLIYLYVT